MKRAFKVRAGNSLTVLLEDLAQLIKGTPLSPFERETIIVQSQGMRRWVTLRLAEETGCAASLRMPFPGAFCHQLAEGHNAEREYSPFCREVLTWRIDRLFDDFMGKEFFAPVAAYTESGKNEVKRHAFCTRMAGLFDDYQIYRPNILKLWEKGKLCGHNRHEPWQTELWRALCAETEAEHLGVKFSSLVERLENADAPPPGLPRRVAIFGINSLPPVFLDLLWSLSRFIEVYIYVVSPTSAPTKDRQNPLLNSLSEQSAVFFSLLHDIVNRGGEWRELSLYDPDGNGILQQIQRDILNRSDSTSLKNKKRISTSDDSLRIHSCHGQLREIEVLRDQLLNSFDNNPNLRPDEVLVLLTDVESYVPYIEAVFGTPVQNGMHIPYRIADRTAKAENPIAASLSALLSIDGSRMGRSEVMDLLEHEPLRESCRLDTDSLAEIQSIIERLNVRWGIDGEHKRIAFGLPPTSANTWRNGIDRLMAGYAAGATDELVSDILPFSGDTVSIAENTGIFCLWLERLFTLTGRLNTNRTLSEWQSLLLDIAADFLTTNDIEAEENLREVEDGIRYLSHLQELSGNERIIPLQVIRKHLENYFSQQTRAGCFISGSVTFSAIKPMRTIPFQVIAICGMGGDSFPRKDARPAFDLISSAPQLGDRSLRADDRQLFLDFLLAAQERLIITYPGRSEKDNTGRAPSVCLGELLDYIDGSFVTEDEKSAAKAIVTSHPLQPFSPSYFNGSDEKLFSYDETLCAAINSGSSTTELPPFIFAPLPPPENIPNVSINELAAAWINPAREFCRKRLGIQLTRNQEEPDDSEPIFIDGLAKYQITERIVEDRLYGQTTDSFPILSGNGLLPHAEIGIVEYNLACSEVEPFIERIGEVEYTQPIIFTHSTPEWSVTGRLEHLTAEGRLQYRFSTLKAKDIIRAWVAHIALNISSANSDEPRISRLLGKDRDITFKPLDNAERELAFMADNYCLMLRKPLPFFAETSLAFATAELAGKYGMKEAFKKWRSSYFNNFTIPGDADNEYVRLCFRSVEPLTQMTVEFAKLALDFWTPVFAATEGGHE